MTSQEQPNVYNSSGEFLTVAERLAENLQDDARAEVVSIIATRYAKLELIDHAIALAETISDPFTRDNTFVEIAAASISAGTSDYADALLEMIDEPAIRSVAIEKIAVKYAELGDLDKSLEMADQLDDADLTLGRIALVDGTSSSHSIELVSSIMDPNLRAATLGQLAILAHRANRKSEAEELLAESLRAAEEIDFSQNRIYALTGIASLYVEIGDSNRAVEILSRALELCESFEGLPAVGLPSSFPRGEALAQIVEGFARVGNFEQADVAAEQIEDPFQFAHASTKEAIEYFRAGQSGQALTLLSEALELVLEEPVYGEQGMLMRDGLLVELAVGFVIAGDVEKSLQVAEKLSSEDQRYVALEQVGKETARRGNARGIFQVAKSITNNYSTTSYWLAITDVLREAAQTDLARQTLFEAAKSAVLIQENYQKAESLIEVAHRFALMNDSAKASELFVLALVTINQLAQDDRKAFLVLRMDERLRELNRTPSEDERELLRQIEG
jgi:tetratricopeptide (TPR) repeat protein